MRAAGPAFALLLVFGCGGETELAPDMSPTPDIGAEPADAEPDAAPDAAPVDMAPADRDAAPIDAAPPDGRVDAASDAGIPDAAVDGGVDGAPDAGIDATVLEPDVVAYCDCMLLTCHDLYHQLWGEDEGVARARCFRVATDLPRAPEATEGDSLDCRRHWCDDAFDLDDPALCGRAGGTDTCL